MQIDVGGGVDAVAVERGVTTTWWRGDVRGAAVGFSLLTVTAAERGHGGAGGLKGPSCPGKDAAGARDDGPEKGFSVLSC